MTYISSSAYALPGIKTFKYSAHDIIKDVANYYHLSPEDLKQKTRVREICLPRHVAMYYTKEFFSIEYKLAAIGQLMGGFDHATVINAVKSVENLMHTDVSFKVHMNNIRSIIDSHRIN